MSQKNFDFYLDAYRYCVKHRISPAKIKRVSFRQWSIAK